VLGLVIEQPDSGFGLERRLEERFGAARFAYSTAYNALYRMEREGLVRVVPSASSNVREARYEATQDGIEHFRAWLRSPGAMPVLREELHAKIALCAPRDLDRLLEMVHDEEIACVRELDRIRAAMVAEAPAVAGRPLAQRDWGELMALGVSHGEAAYWGGRAAQLSQLRRYLADLRDEARRRIVEEDRHTLAARRRAV
jgi:DNA-binding PadR family transcriptional regulator